MQQLKRTTIEILYILLKSPTMTTTPVSVHNTWNEYEIFVFLQNSDEWIYAFPPTVPAIIPQIWTQSSVESASYDADYEANVNGPSSDFTLSTFRSEFI